MDGLDFTANRAGVDLVAALRAPTSLADLPDTRLDGAIRLARRTSLLPRLAVALGGSGTEAGLAPRVRDLLIAARATAEHHRRNLRWEADRIARALSGTACRVVALKGAAYELAGLAAAPGRMSSDFDVLVPLERVDDVERALHAAGWRSDCKDPYDQRYYRLWMHEIPPMRHEGRGTIVDVHHTLAPRTSRTVRPDVEALWRDARPVAGTAYEILAPEDVVLHCAIHAFHDGDLSEPLRDLVDLDALCRDYAARDTDFWRRLLARAGTHRAVRPLYWGLRYAAAVLGTPVPPDVRRELERTAPPGGTEAWMDRLLSRALFPSIEGPASVAAVAATTALYVRSHALRMPPHRLLVHLGRKAWRRTRHLDDERKL